MHAIRIHGYGGPEVMELEALATAHSRHRAGSDSSPCGKRQFS
jgi:hypothetical protein